MFTGNVLIENNLIAYTQRRLLIHIRRNTLVYSAVINNMLKLLNCCVQFSIENKCIVINCYVCTIRTYL